MLFRFSTPARALLTASAAAVALVLLPQPFAAAPVPQSARAASLPARLSPQELWKLIGDISEPGGYFRITDNYTSNENEIGQIFTTLREQNKSGGVYIGVGPEQNLTYIAAIKPAMAFIIDIRRQAVVQHLMFKAMMEMSKDRADFLSLLFAKPRPQSVTASMSIQDMWNAYFGVLTDQALATSVHNRVVERLEKTHGFTLTPDERA